MKIKLDKKYIQEYQMERVKADAKEFSQMYTNGDLLREFLTQTASDVTMNVRADDIIRMDIKAMDAGWFYGEKTIYCVTMFLYDWDKMYKIRFYVDQYLTVDTKDGLWSVVEFNRVH